MRRRSSQRANQNCPCTFMRLPPSLSSRISTHSVPLTALLCRTSRLTLSPDPHVTLVALSRSHSRLSSHPLAALCRTCWPTTTRPPKARQSVGCRAASRASQCIVVHAANADSPQHDGPNQLGFFGARRAASMPTARRGTGPRPRARALRSTHCRPGGPLRARLPPHTPGALIPLL